MRTPRTLAGVETDPAVRRRRLLGLVTHAARKSTDVINAQHATWKAASEAGASYREIADADGTVSHMTVKRSLEGRSTAGLTGPASE